MKLSDFRKKSITRRVWSVVLTIVMVFNLMCGYVAVSESSVTDVKAATKTLAELKAENKASSATYRNVMYYGEWSVYAGQKNFYPSKIDGSLITHLNFAFMDVDEKGNLNVCDYWADFDNPNVGYSVGSESLYAGVLGAMLLLRQQYPNMKIGISVGGWTRSGAFPKLASTAETRKKFAQNIAKFVHYYGYDFVDIDWEYPTADRDPDPTGNGVTVDKGCKGSEADTKNFTLLMQELRNTLDEYSVKDGKYYELSCAMSASPAMMAKIEYDKVLQTVDFANMMTYDLNGAWNGYTAHQTALYTNDSYDHDKQKADEALALYNKLLELVSGNKRSLEYRSISAEKIYLYKLLGRFDEACRIYQELYTVTDTLASKSYIRQINALKATYQIDELELGNKAQENRIVLASIFIGLGLLAFISMLAVWQRKQKKKVALSKRNLEQSRWNAESATRAKSVFLSNMSHEIRTPLNALSGFSALLTEEGLDDATRLQCTEIIQQNSELLSKLINDVIDLSSLEFGKMQFSIGEHDAVATCRNVTDTVGKVKQTQAELLFVTSLEELKIETDDSRLQQVLINLLINATKFTAEGAITLKLEKESDDMALFSVTDTGCGIPKEKQAHIFQRFEKLDENAQGSGLGLSICQLIIEHIGGRIWIDPDYDEGSRFLFTHPIRQTKGTQKKEGRA